MKFENEVNYISNSSFAGVESLVDGVVIKIEKIMLPELDLERNIIIIKKVKQTPSRYPRKPGIPQKEPIK